MVQSKNVVSTLLQSYICMGVVTVLWVFFTFSICFAPSLPSGYNVWGDPAVYYFFNHVGAAPAPALAATIPLSIYAMFQVRPGSGSRVQDTGYKT